jgi:hypothetical protein
MATDRGRRTFRSKKRIPVPASRQGLLRLARGVQLKDGRNGREAVLVGPAGKVELNNSAVAILRLCDGSRDRLELIAEMVRGSDQQLQVSDIAAFLDAARAREWIEEGGGD